jgi:hypothetical protein
MKTVGTDENAHTTDSKEIAFATGEFTQTDDHNFGCDYVSTAEQTESFRIV